MPPNNASQSRALINALSNPDIAPFIDRRKLAKSSELVEMAEEAASHFTKHGDRQYLDKLLKIFPEPDLFPVLLQWICSRTGLSARFENDHLVLEKSSSEPNPKASLRDALSGGLTPVAIPKKPAAKKVVKTAAKTKSKRKLVKIDMLDSRARLPGSFESGKRR